MPAESIRPVLPPVPEHPGACRWTGGFSDLVGYVITPRPDGVWAVTLAANASHCNEFWVLHGGALMTLLDIAGGCALHALEKELAWVATISISTNFVRAGQPGLLTAIGQCDGGGATVVHTTMRVHQGDETGPVLATAQASYRLFRKPTPKNSGGPAGPRSNIQVGDGEGVVLDEHPTRLNHIPHQY